MYLHVDINSYFATMLQQENPMLRGKPIGVLKAAGRTCIIAASKEAKKMGVQTGSRVSDAKLVCPQILLVPAAFDIYLSSTYKLRDLFAAVCPEIDIFSLDEAFLDLSDSPQLTEDPLSLAREIQGRVKATLGSWVTCNVGIAKNKLLAKLASNVGEKGSIFQITEQNLTEVLATTTLADVCGVGYRLGKKLHLLGVHHPYEINLLPRELLEDTFGPFWSEELMKIAIGEETHFFTHEKKVAHMQSVGRSITGYGLCNDETVIKQTILNLTEEAALKMRQMKLQTGAVGISLSGGGKTHDHWGAHQKLYLYQKHSLDLFHIVYDQLYRSWQRSFPILKFGVWFGDLKPDAYIPQQLLPEESRKEIITSVVDQINDHFGAFAIKRATLMGRPLILPEVTGFLGDKTYRGL